MVGVVLARLLSPEAFGIVGMALIAIGFGRSLGDFGFGAAIIQRPSVTQTHIRAAFTGSVTMGILLFSVLWFAAPAISRLFMYEGLIPVLQIIGVSLIFFGMSATPVSLLRRELRFRTLASIETASYMIGFGVVGVSMAVLGCGVWSLVAATITQPFCLAVLAVYFTKQPLGPHFGIREYRDLVRMASAEVLNNITNYFAENLGFFVVGKWLGASALGLFNRAFYLMALPVTHFSTALSNVMFPLYSKVQGNIPRLGRVHLRIVTLTAVVSMPVMFAMAAAPEIVIGGLFGRQWKAAAGALQILCVSGPFMAILRPLGALSHARGYVLSEWWRQVMYLAVMVLALWFLLPRGIEGAALAIALATVARYLLLAQLGVRLSGVTWRHFFSAQVPGFLLGLIVFVSVHLACVLGDLLGMSDVLQLLFIMAVSMLSLILSFLLVPSSWFGDLYPWVLERFGMSFPGRLRKILAAKISPV